MKQALNLGKVRHNHGAILGYWHSTYVQGDDRNIWMRWLWKMFLFIKINDIKELGMQCLQNYGKVRESSYFSRDDSTMPSSKEYLGLTMQLQKRLIFRGEFFCKLVLVCASSSSKRDLLLETAAAGIANTGWASFFYAIFAAGLSQLRGFWFHSRFKRGNLSSIKEIAAAQAQSLKCCYQTSQPQLLSNVCSRRRNREQYNSPCCGQRLKFYIMS